jgi:hypothetical protein
MTPERTDFETLEDISFHEALRRFAIGEVHSQFYAVDSASHRKETMDFLVSGNEQHERVGIDRALQRRRPLIGALPPGIHWFLGTLILSPALFERLLTIPDPEWKRRSGGSCQLVAAAKFLSDHPGADPRVTSISVALSLGAVEMTGITLLAREPSGPFTVVEGTGRLIALYWAQNAPSVAMTRIQVVLGLAPLTVPTSSDPPTSEQSA